MIINLRTLFIGAFLASSAAWGIAIPQDVPLPKADNTKANQRDKSAGEVTADQQAMNADDRALTAKIRRAVMADKSLSTYAHNAKIISQGGVVTLKGPVRSDKEVRSLISKAIEAAGTSEKVINELEVKH